MYGQIIDKAAADQTINLGEAFFQALTGDGKKTKRLHGSYYQDKPGCREIREDDQQLQQEGEYEMLSTPKTQFHDNEKLFFGDGQDIELYFDGTDFNIKSDSGDIELNSYKDIIFYEQGTQMGKLSYNANVTTLEGGGVSEDNLILKANSTDATSYIDIRGNKGIVYATTNYHNFYIEGTRYARIYDSGDDAVIEGPVNSGDNLILKANSTDADSKIEIEGLGDIFLDANGAVKFGTYAAITTETLAGYITIKDAAGNSRKLAVVA